MKYIVYADLESLIKKIDRCANNAKKSSKRQVNMSVADIQCHLYAHLIM